MQNYCIFFNLLSTNKAQEKFSHVTYVPCACVTAPPMVSGLTVTVPWLTPVTPAPAVLTITLLGMMMEFPPPTETAWPPCQETGILNIAFISSSFLIENELICRVCKSLVPSPSRTLVCSVPGVLVSHRSLTFYLRLFKH